MVLFGTSRFVEDPKKAIDEQKELRKFEYNRLYSISKPSVVIVGTSLVQYGLPFDDELTQYAQSTGLPQQFLRITRGRNREEPFYFLFPHLLKNSPDYLFLQAELFFLDINCNSDAAGSSREVVATVRTDILPGSIKEVIHSLNSTTQIFYRSLEHLYKDLLNKVSDTVRGDNNRRSYQNDSLIRKEMNKVAESERIVNAKCTFTIRNKNFNPVVEQFITDITNKGTKIILLEMNRSFSGQSLMGLDARNELNQTLFQISKQHDLTYWQFSGLADSYYLDRAHLNNEGRKEFTSWFLSQLKSEGRP